MDRNESETASVRIGSFVVDPLSREIRAPDGSTVRIDPKPMAVLMALVDADGQVVSRDALFDRVWPDSIVIDEALTRCISELRKALNDSVSDQSVIRTIRGTGYQLIECARPETFPRNRNDEDAPIPFQHESSLLRRSFLPILATAVILTASLVSLRADLSPDLAPPNVRRLTLDAGIERKPALSPDGLRLAYLASQDGKLFELQILDSLSHRPRQLEPGMDNADEATFMSPAWSADGSVLAVIRRTSELCSVLVTESHDYRFRTVADCTGHLASGLELSYDGSELIFSVESSRTGRGQLMLVQMDGSSADSHPLLRNPGVFGDHGPSISPDGNRIAFIRNRTGSQSDVFLLNRKAGTVRQLTSEGGSIRGVDWIDNNRIVYSSDRSGAFQLWTIDTRESTPSPQWIPSGTDNAMEPSVAVNTGAIAFYHDRSSTGLYGVENGEVVTLISNAARNGAPRISPDASRITYVSNASGDVEIWVAGIDGDNARPITHLKAHVDAPNWSPDGTRIAFHGNLHGSRDIFVAHLASGDVERITRSNSEEMMPVWSQDGSRIYFSSNGTGRWEIWYLDVTKFRQDAVPTGLQGMRLVESTAANGDSAFYVAGLSNDGIQVVDRHFEVRDKILPEVQNIDWGGWALSSAGLFFVSRDVARITLHLSESMTGNSRTVATLCDESPWSVPWDTPALDVSADGRTIVFTRSLSSEGEIVLIENPERI